LLEEKLMPKVVVVGVFLECSHGGKTKISSGNERLKVDGSAVITLGLESGYAFLPANSPPTPDQPAPCKKLAPVTPFPPSPCSATLAAITGVSTKIKVGGVGVLLDTASGPAVNANDPAATWKITDAGQPLLEEL
jgi:hypothetical protein